jgi:hypothetical protein
MKKLILGALLLLSMISCSTDDNASETPRIGHIYKVEVPYQIDGSINPEDGIINDCWVMTKNPLESVQIIDGVKIDLSYQPSPSQDLSNGWHYIGYTNSGQDPVVGSLNGYNWDYGLVPSDFTIGNVSHKKGRIEFIAYTGDIIGLNIIPNGSNNTSYKIYRDNILFREETVTSDAVIKYKVE